MSYSIKKFTTNFTQSYLRRRDDDYVSRNVIPRRFLLSPERFAIKRFAAKRFATEKFVAERFATENIAIIFRKICYQEDCYF